MNTENNEPEFVEVRAFSTGEEAEAARMALAGSGIEAFLTTDDLGNMVPSLQFVQGVKLLVRPKDQARAEDVLTDTSGNSETPDG